MRQKASMTNGFEYVFPAIRGIQARREYYVSMCPMRLLSKLFEFDGEEMVPELRAQRQINKGRVPEIARYITENLDNYVFSAVTVSIDSTVRFDQLAIEGDTGRVGMLHIPMSARFVVNDGQHRRAAIDRALREKPELGDESIAVVFFIDAGLARCQQMFADLNRYAIRPSKGLAILYDHRDETGRLAKDLISNSPVFRDVVELEKTSLSPRSRCLFTLSAIYNATEELLNGMQDMAPTDSAALALKFWEAVARHIGEWELVRKGKLSAGEVREDFIHTHGVVLQSLARAGRSLMDQFPKQWESKLDPLKTINWRRTNSSLWEGRVLLGGQVSKSHQTINLTTNAIKRHLGLSLSAEEERVEEAFTRGNHGSKS